MLRIYIIGAGAIALQHARAVAALKGAVSERHVCDPVEARRAAFVEANPKFRAWPTAQAMLALPAKKDDIVVVATPPSSHVALAELAMRSGRHALVEKPLALNAAGMRRLLKVSRATGKKFSDCSVRFLGSPAVGRAAKILRQGTIGEPGQVRWIHRFRRSRPGVEYQPQSSWFLNRKLAGGGILVDWAPYDLRVLIELLDPLAFEVRQAWTAQFINGREPKGVVNDVETQIAADCVFHLRGGKKVQLSYERASAVYGREEALAEIEGEKGALRFDWLGWIDNGQAVLSSDRAGKPFDTRLALPKDRLDLQFKPLHYFAASLAKKPGPSMQAWRACYAQACVLALADAAASGKPKLVRRSDWERA